MLGVGEQLGDLVAQADPAQRAQAVVQHALELGPRDDADRGAEPREQLGDQLGATEVPGDDQRLGVAAPRAAARAAGAMSGHGAPSDRHRVGLGQLEQHVEHAVDQPLAIRLVGRAASATSVRDRRRRAPADR